MTRGQYRDAFVVEATSGRRFEVALERFLQGHSFEYRDATFVTARDGSVVVVMESSWSIPDVTAETALADFEIGQSVFRELVSSSESFASAIEGRPVRYELGDDTGSVVLCVFADGKMTWSPGMPDPVVGDSTRTHETALPAEVVRVTVRWLNEMDVGLAGIGKAARGLGLPAGPAIAVAVADVAERIAHFRLALAGAVELTDLLPSSWNPLGTVDSSIAEAIHLDVRRVASLPAEVTTVAHSCLIEESCRRAFLRQVGDVAGSAFLNLARSLWNDHPHLAPPGWTETR